MELALERENLTNEYTLGTLYAVGTKLCVTCEDAVRGGGDPRTVSEWKIADKSAIPYGRYQVIIDFSPHFQKHLPHLLDVPGFDGIRIHGGNTAEDTEGCILVGLSFSNTGIKNCAPAVQKIMDLITQANARNEQTWITIS